MSSWFYAADNKPIGPLDDASIRRLAVRGQITRSTLIWKEGMSDWLPAERVGLLAGRPSASPPGANEFAMMLAACRAEIGPVPRNLRMTRYLELKPPRWMKKRPSDPLWEIYRQSIRLYERGVIVWGSFVQANSQLFSVGQADCPASVIYSPDRFYDNYPQELRRIAHSLYAVKGTEQDDPELAEFSRVLHDELDRALRLPVPMALTRGRAVYHTSVMVHRKHLPHGYITGGFFPLLIDPFTTPAAIILPCEFWPDALLVLWTPQLR